MALRELMPRIIRLASGPVIGVNNAFQKITVTGEENIPLEGPLLVVSNHTSCFDATTLAEIVYKRGRVPRFAAKADLFTVPLLGRALRMADQVPVYRSDVISAPKDGGTPASSMKAMEDALAEGKTLIVFPESTYTRDPLWWPMRAKTGVARLIMAHPEVCVVPVAHWGNEEMVDSFRNKIRWNRVGRGRTHVRYRIGRPVDCSAFVGREATHDLLTELTEHVMTAITDELVHLRAEDVAAGNGPRERRWDVRVDGDPHKSVIDAGQAKTARRQDRRLKWKRLSKKLHLSR